MKSKISPTPSENGELAIEVGSATTELGLFPREALQTVLEQRDDIKPKQFKEAILPQAIHILRKCSGDGRISNHRNHLAIGYVQSGKTISMATVACLAHDNGYNVIVVFAGRTTNLVKQTTDRFRNYIEDSAPEACRVIDTKSDGDLAKKMALVENKLAALSLDPEDRTLVIITMKHHAHLQQLAAVFNRQKIKMKNLKPGGADVLFIDDEADELSLNSKVNQADVSTTHAQLMALRDAVPNFSFVQYTATPQGPLLISLNDPLSPEHVTILEPGKGYVGGKQFFDPTESPKYIRDAEDADLDVSKPPKALLNAFYTFLLACSQLHLTGKMEKKRNKDAPSVSFMIHPDFKIEHHKKWLKWVKDAWDDCKINLRQFDPKDPSAAAMMAPYQAAYDDLYQHAEQREMRPLVDLFQNLTKVGQDLEFWEVNGEGRNVNWKDGKFHVLVGGNKLNRGFTVEGLITSYLTRGGKALADTLEQRCRFFGYKKKYLDLCRLYLTLENHQNFLDYVRHEEHYREVLKPYEEKSLREFQREFWLSPDMEPTRKQILSDPVVRGVKGEKWWSQRQHVHLSQQAHDKNIQHLTKVIQTIQSSGATNTENHLVWQTTDIAEFVIKWLQPYQVSPGREQMEWVRHLTDLASRINRNFIERIEFRLMRADQVSVRNSKAKNGAITLFAKGGGASADTKQYNKDPKTATILLYNMESHWEAMKQNNHTAAKRTGPALALRLPSRPASEYEVSQPTNQ